MQKYELFENYEFIDKKRAPFIVKLMIGSLLLHTIVFASAIYVPGIRDAFHLASLFAVDSKYVDKDYTKTEFGEDFSDVTVVDTSNFLKYPDGYFAGGDTQPIATTPQTIDPMQPQVTETVNGSPSTLPDLGNLAANNPPILPTPPTTLDTDTIKSPWEQVNTPSVVPTPNKTTPPIRAKTPKIRNPKTITPTPTQNPTLSNESPTTLPGLTDPSTTTATKKTPRNKPEVKPTATPTPTPETTAQTSPTPEEDKLPQVEINKKPLKDYAKALNAKLEKNEVDLNAPFKIVIDGTLSKDGKLVNPVIKKSLTSGDERMQQVITDAVGAMNDSGWLSYLKALGGQKVLVVVEQNDKETSVQLVSQIKDEAEAKRISSGLNLIITLGKTATSGDDERKLLEKAKATPNGKQVVVSIVMPRGDLADIIKRKLEGEKKDNSQADSGKSTPNNAE
jgi:hypothetical protein